MHDKGRFLSNALAVGHSSLLTMAGFWLHQCVKHERHDGEIVKVDWFCCPSIQMVTGTMIFCQMLLKKVKIKVENYSYRR